MPANFPNSPTLNQQYSYAGATWSWTGTHWQALDSPMSSGATGATGPAGSPGTSANVSVAGSAPVSPNSGTLWFNNETGDLYVYAGGGWVLIGGGGGSSSGGVAAVYDIESTSTGYFDLPSGNTAQRPGSPPTGALRYNSTTGFAEVYTAAGWGSFGAQPPSISTVAPATYNGDAGTTFTINGANFTADATVKFVDASSVEYTAAVVTFVNSGTLTATTPQDFTVAQEPLDVKVVQVSGQVVKLDCIDCGGTPTWTTTAGLLATINDEYGSYSPIVTLIATDPDAGATIGYSVVSGSLPAGTALGASTGQISGNPTNVVSQTTSNFTIRATDNAGNSSDRAFSIIVNPTADGSTAARAGASAAALKSLLSTTTSTYYWILIGGTPRQVYCDMSGATAWMLAMRASGSAETSTFGWSSAYWTNATSLNETGDPLTDINIKNGYIWQSFTVANIRLTGNTTATAYNTNATTTFSGFNTTLQTMFSSANNSYSTNVEWGRTNWINWCNSAAGTATSHWDNQPNCNLDAVNANGTYHAARFGISFNNENDCASNDSGIGFGQYRQGMTELACGGIKWNADVRYPCHGWFWVN